MNLQQTIAYIKALLGVETDGITTANLDALKALIDPQRAEWERVTGDIEPHYYGDMPTAIKDAFPNEPENVFNYRKKNFRSKTKSHLWQAITDVNRLISGSRFRIETGAQMSEYLESDEGKIEGNTVLEFLFDCVSPFRVLDANGFVVVMPHVNEAVTGVDSNKSIDFEDRLISTKEIVYLDNEVLIFRENSKDNKSFGDMGFDYSDSDKYYFLTKEWYLILETKGGKTAFAEYYEHGAGVIPAVAVGGHQMKKYDKKKKKYFSFYESDFSAAVPYMDDFSVLVNQLKSTTLTRVFPFMIMRGVTCKTCNGKGKTTCVDSSGQAIIENELTTEEKCKTCDGVGTTQFSALSDIVVTSPLEKDNIGGKTQEAKPSALDGQFISWSSPPIGSVVELREQKSAEYIEMINALNIATPTKFAESGISKEKDRESKYSQLQNISGELARIARQFLTIKAAIRYGAASEEIAAIKIIEPSSFQIQTLEDLRLAAFSDAAAKPHCVRYAEYFEYIGKKFADDATKLKLAEIEYYYTDGLSIVPAEERSEMMASGCVSKADCIRAARVCGVLQRLTAQGDINVLKDDYKAIETKINAVIEEKYLKELTAVPAVEIE